MSMNGETYKIIARVVYDDGFKSDWFYYGKKYTSMRRLFQALSDIRKAPHEGAVSYDGRKSWTKTHWEYLPAHNY